MAQINKCSPLQTCKGDCVFKSQKRTVVSPEPLASCLPEGLKLVDITASAWPGIELKKKNVLITDWPNRY